MLLSQIAKKFGALVGKGLPWTVIGEVFLLSLPFIIAMTLPMAVLLAVLAQEHERAAGGWHAEWGPLSDALAYSGGAASWMRETLTGLEVDAERMRANVRDDDVLSEARRLGFEAARPEQYLGAAEAFVDRALALYGPT